MKFSVIVLGYNVKECLNMCIHLLAKQTFSDMEICWLMMVLRILPIRFVAIWHKHLKIFHVCGLDDWVDVSIVEKFYIKTSFC